MSVFLLGLWTKFKGWIVAGASALALLVGIYLKGRSDQSQINKTKNLEDKVKTIDKARKVEDEVRKMSPSDVDSGLDRFMRD